MTKGGHMAARDRTETPRPAAVPAAAGLLREMESLQ
jgi:hypothetical protein